MHRVNYCSSHTGEVMSYYCKTCDRPVCDDCTFLDHPKTKHALVALSDATTTHRRQLAELLANVRRKLPFLKQTLLHIDSVLEAVPDHADAVAREIARNTEACIHALKQRQEQLLDDLTKLCLHKTRVLQEQKGRIQSELEVSVANCQTTENILRTGSDSEISSVHSLVCERMQVLDEMTVDIEADEDAEFNYDAGGAVLTDAIHSNGKVHLSSASGSPLRAIGDGLHNAAVGKVAMFTLAKSKHSGHVSPGDIDVRIETPDSVILACDVTHSGSLYTVSYSPRVPGEHEISIAFQGEHLPDSPVCVNVKMAHVVCTKAHACLVIGRRGNSPGCFDRVCDVAVRSNGNILSVDSFNHRVQTFSSNGSFISQFGMKGEGLGRLLYPTGLAISPEGHVIVTEHGNHRVQLFTSDGAHLLTFGGHGNGNGLMDHPTGVAVDEEGQLVVVDQHNHRIQVFNASGHFKYRFGCYGNQNGQFDRPMFAAINQDGEIFVTDSGNHRIQIFDEGGRFRRAFGRQGTDDGEFFCPTGVTVDACGYVIVSDKSNRIQVFTSELDFVTKLDARDKGGGKLDCPMGLDFTPGGRIAVADQGNASVKVLYT